MGIKLPAIEARFVVASIETYLKYAEAVGLTCERHVIKNKRGVRFAWFSEVIPAVEGGGDV
ncbi:hypothetical protein Plut_0685 [Pelodictyon luteolum DSM 273]|uniref:Uncharacterized protein n=1 Tax=Chlorobium luteolum (strain DSM 273 / BCRC 81028 / 2530) TaxID=319225 RepID=Q3B518_CHLL3|nr:hypothetical protein Plut_0685 [Pelodictyon luteolum DSM 273]